jgi:hypothetical protein
MRHFNKNHIAGSALHLAVLARRARMREEGTARDVTKDATPEATFVQTSFRIHERRALFGARRRNTLETMTEHPRISRA